MILVTRQHTFHESKARMEKKNNINRRANYYLSAMTVSIHDAVGMRH
jgi:hypothetical protein